ncbi:MAG: hypothetical protein MI974_10020 [Chitinophagales bacterium]|nr:hypothetical protein [Chitinophagales bacterium]
MSVSYFQVLYSRSGETPERATDSKSTPIYKLDALSLGSYFKRFIQEKFGHEVYAFSSGQNLIEESGLPPLSTEFLEPEAILKDLGLYRQLLIMIKSEMVEPKEKLLSEEIRRWSIDHHIDQLEFEINALESVCNYAKEKEYLMKFGCDY